MMTYCQEKYNLTISMVALLNFALIHFTSVSMYILVNSYIRVSMRNILILISVLSLSYAEAQINYKTTQHSAKFIQQINPRELKPDFNAQLFSLEAPLPDGVSYKSFLMRQKIAQRKRLKPEGIQKSNADSFNAIAPQIARSFGMKRYLGSGSIVDVAGGIPNDNTLAVSDSGIVLAGVNSVIYGWDLNTDTILFPNSIISLRSLAGPSGIDDYYFDPKFIYDEVNDRFILVFLKNSDPATNGYMLAFSTSNNPLDPWNTYFLSGNPLNNNRWTDFPAISLSNGELFITGNLIIDTAPTWQEGFDGSIIWQIQTSSGYTGAAELNSRLHSDIRFGGKFIRNLHPVIGAIGQADQQFFLSNRNFDLENDTVFVLRMASSLEEEANLIIKQTTTNLPYGMPPNGRQTDTEPNDSTGGLQTNDARVLGAILLDNEIQYVANSVDPQTGFSAVYHGFVQDLTGNPTVTGRILGDSHLDFGYPNIAYSGNELCDKEVIIGFNYSAPDSFPGMACRYYSNNDEYSPITILKKGENYVNRLGGTYERWGDYFGLQRWNSQPGHVLAAGFYGLISKQNGTWMAELVSPDTSQLLLTISESGNSTVCAGVLKANVSSGIPPYSYLWNGIEGTDEYSNACAGTATQLSVQDARGCSIERSIIPEINSVENSLYPNPFSDHVNYKFTLEADAEILASIYDGAGKLIAELIRKDAKKGLNELQFLTDPLAKGVYFLRIEVNGEQKYLEKLLKATD